MKISQSLIKDIRHGECPQYIKFKYKDEIRTPSTAAQINGNYFEYKLLGSCAFGQVPEFKPLKDGSAPKPQTDLDEQITLAKIIIDSLGIVLSDGQTEIIVDDLIAHIDNFPTINGRKVILDLKYTETAADDKWRGWGDIEDGKHHLQPLHYVYVHHKSTGEYLPFYYLVFGKQKINNGNSGVAEYTLWCKVIKVEISPEALDRHDRELDYIRSIIEQYEGNGYKAEPEFNKCNVCPFNDRCKFVSTVPEIETITIT